jgi:proteic killer suppression protein
MLRMIRSFRGKHTAALFGGQRCKPQWKAFRSVAERKLAMLQAAQALSDLRVPPNNHLEALRRERLGQHSIRINDQFRICFRWSPDGPVDVEIVDYH